MDIKKIVNIVCLIVGLAVICFSIVMKSGLLANLDPNRFMLPLLLGFIIVLWSGISLYRNR